MIGIDPDLARFAVRFEEIEIPCIVVGAIASSAFGEPRSTLGIDLVVAASPADAERIVASFPPERYCTPPAAVVRHELGRGPRGCFSIIDAETSLKADVSPLGDDEVERDGMARRVPVVVPGAGTLHLASPARVAIGKLRFYAMSPSGKHLRDIRAMLRLHPEQIDAALVERHARLAGVLDAWRGCLARLGAG